jgi:capsid protein
LLSERDFYRGLQVWVVEHLHRVVFTEWTKFAGLAGEIPIRDPLEYQRAACWKARGWKWVDPLNDVQAAAISVQEGFTTRSDVCAEQGMDFEDNIDRRADEEKYAENAGVILGAAKPVVPRQPASASADTSSANTQPGAEGTNAEETGAGQPPARSLRLARSLAQ